MFKVSVHKEWEYVIHPECLDKGDFETSEFKTCKEEVNSNYVSGRFCVHCKTSIINKPPEERKIKKKTNKVRKV